MSSPNWLCRTFQFGCMLFLGVAAAETVMAGSASGAKPDAAVSKAERYQEVIEQAINGELPLDFEVDDEQPILITAILYGSDQQVQRLLEKGHDPNANYLSIPALIFTVAAECEYEKLRLLLAVGADANIAEPLGGSFAIHSAAQHRDVRCLEALIVHGAVPSVVDGAGRSAYFYAVDFASEPAIQYLWKAGVDPKTGTWAGMDIFEYGALMNRAELLQDLLPTQR